MALLTGFGARAPLRIAAGVIQQAIDQPVCPEGTKPHYNVSGDTAVFAGCKVQTTTFTQPSLLGGLAKFGLQAISNFFAPGSGLIGTTLTGLKESQVGEPERIIAPLLSFRGGTMAFEDGDSGFFGKDGFLSGVGEILQGGLGQNLLGIGTQALSGFVRESFAPQAIQTMAAVPAIMRGGAMVGRAFFNRFPALATAIQSYANRGIAVNRSKLWGLLKRFGPEFLITGGILSSAAIGELMVAGPGRRRMNAGNVKALRRAHRRMKAFHSVCVSNDRLLGGRRPKRKGFFTGGTQITQVK
jgi:hypothetical protein